MPTPDELVTKRLADALLNLHQAALASAKARKAPERAEAEFWLKMAVRRLSEALADATGEPRPAGGPDARPAWK